MVLACCASLFGAGSGHPAACAGWFGAEGRHLASSVRLFDAGSARPTPSAADFGAGSGHATPPAGPLGAGTGGPTPSAALLTAGAGRPVGSGDRVRPRDEPEAILPPVPRAVADRAGTRAGQSVDVPVLAGDSGEGLVVLSYTNPEHGLVLQRDEADSVLRYTPGPGFTGRDSFRYTIVDRLGREATASVRIEVVAGPGASGRPVETRAGKLGVHRGVDELRAPSAASAARPRAGVDPGGGSLLVAFLGSAVLGAGVLAFVAHRRPGRRRLG